MRQHGHRDLQITNPRRQGDLRYIDCGEIVGPPSVADRTWANSGHALNRNTSVMTPGGRQQFRVLLIDDNRDAADILARLLRNAGNRVQTAYSGFEALEGAGEFLPDCIISDIRMPGLDGYEVARRFRSDRRFEQTPLIALTANTDEARVNAAGFNHHLVKPVTSSALVALIVDLESMSQRLKMIEGASQEQAEVLEEVKDLMQEVRDDVQDLKAELKEEVQELKQELQEVKEEVKELKQAEE
jgi:two-component system, OmpR family, response regulator